MCDKLGLKTIEEAIQFAETIVDGQVVDQELLDILREAVIKQNTRLSYSDKLKLLDYNNALRLAKETNAIYAYGYSKEGKFVEIDPIKLEQSEIEFERGFKEAHPDCEVLYFAYPDKSFMAEAAKETLSGTRSEEEKPVKRDLKILKQALSEAMDDLDDFTVDSQCDELDVDCAEEE